MTSRVSEIIIDCSDLESQSRFWQAVTGYVEGSRGDGWVSLRHPADPVAAGGAAAAVSISLVVVPEPKTAKNRVHLDVTPDGSSQAEEVARLESLGATRVDIGQKDTTWVVMADPEGNEFCVMSGA